MLWAKTLFLGPFLLVSRPIQYGLFPYRTARSPLALFLLLPSGSTLSIQSRHVSVIFSADSSLLSSSCTLPSASTWTLPSPALFKGLRPSHNLCIASLFQNPSSLLGITLSKPSSLDSVTTSEPSPPSSSETESPPRVLFGAHLLVSRDSP